MIMYRVVVEAVRTRVRVVLFGDSVIDDKYFDPNLADEIEKTRDEYAHRARQLNELADKAREVERKYA